MGKRKRTKAPITRRVSTRKRTRTTKGIFYDQQLEEQLEESSASTPAANTSAVMTNIETTSCDSNADTAIISSDGCKIPTDAQQVSIISEPSPNSPEDEDGIDNGQDNKTPEVLDENTPHANNDISSIGSTVQISQHSENSQCHPTVDIAATPVGISRGENLISLKRELEVALSGSAMIPGKVDENRDILNFISHQKTF